jgi:hypothetical protein
VVKYATFFLKVAVVRTLAKAGVNGRQHHKISVAELKAKVKGQFTVSYKQEM